MENLITLEYLWGSGWEIADSVHNTVVKDSVYWIRFHDSEMSIKLDRGWEEKDLYNGKIPTIFEFETLKKLLEL